MGRARYWHELEGGRIQCDVCPRFCKLREGQRGLCFVRAREGDEIVLTTYGRSSGFCVDPIEKKPLNHFLPGTPVLSFGTAGCNLTCKFCQNWDISKATEFDRLQDEASPAEIARAAQAVSARSVAFTYNDPVIFLEYAVDVANACRDAGLKTVAVTAGYIAPEARKEFFGAMDAANIDLKGFTESFYKTLCTAELKPVLEMSIGTSMWDSGRSVGFRSFHVGFSGFWSRLKGHSNAGDSVGQTDGTLRNVRVDRPVDQSQFECPKCLAESQLKCPEGHFSLNQAIEI